MNLTGEETIPQTIQCKLCNKYFVLYDMYLYCHICHRLFSCFFCGSQERQKYFNGLPSKVYNGKTYKIKCPKHLDFETEKCEIGEKCKICNTK